jgi:hypothetical protein
MFGKSVMWHENGSDPTLRANSGAFAWLSLGYNEDMRTVCGFEGEGKASDTGSDDENVS